MHPRYFLFFFVSGFRKSIVLAWLLVIAIGLLGATTPPASGQEQKVRWKLSAQQTDQGRRFIKQLKAYALLQAEEGSDRYWAIIRTNLPRVPTNAAKSGRGFTPTVSENFSDNVSVLPQDSDPAMHQALKRKMQGISIGARIVGGKRVGQGKLDAVIALRDKDKRVFCSGTYIGERTILTAAHCVCDLDLANVENPGEVAFGNNMKNNASQSYEIIETRLFDPAVCPDYKKAKPRSLNGRDLAIVRIAYNMAQGSGHSLLKHYSTKTDAAVRGSDIRPAPIAKWPLYFRQETTNLHLVGFGYDEDHQSGIKMHVEVPISDRLCSHTDSCEPGKELVLIDRIAMKKDSCNGDSGGPAFINIKSENYLIGVTSRAVDPSGACGHGGIYGLITPKVIDWLVEEIGISLSLCSAPGRCMLRQASN